jgi:hypothetical protein
MDALLQIFLRMVLSEHAAEGSAAAVEFSVNMTCGSCAKKIRDALLKADVKSFKVCTFLIYNENLYAFYDKIILKYVFLYFRWMWTNSW